MFVKPSAMSVVVVQFSSLGKVERFEGSPPKLVLEISDFVDKVTVVLVSHCLFQPAVLKVSFKHPLADTGDVVSFSKVVEENRGPCFAFVYLFVVLRLRFQHSSHLAICPGVGHFHHLTVDVPCSASVNR